MSVILNGMGWDEMRRMGGSDDGASSLWWMAVRNKKEERWSEEEMQAVYERTGFDCNVPVSRRRLPTATANIIESNIAMPSTRAHTRSRHAQHSCISLTISSLCCCFHIIPSWRVDDGSH